MSSYPTSIGSTSNNFRCGEQGLWSTAYLPSGTDLSTLEIKLFATARSCKYKGKVLDGLDTNILTPGRVPSDIASDITSVSFRAETCAPWGDLDSLALSHRDIVPFKEGQAKEIMASSYASWDFVQTRISICPLWQESFSYKQHPVCIPAHSSFGIVVNFSEEAGKLTQPHRIRCFLHMAYRTAITIR